MVKFAVNTLKPEFHPLPEFYIQALDIYNSLGQYFPEFYKQIPVEYIRYIFNLIKEDTQQRDLIEATKSVFYGIYENQFSL